MGNDNSALQATMNNVNPNDVQPINVTSFVNSVKQTFIWQIPSMLPNEINLLCTGYIKENCTKYITKPIIQLCCQYFTNDEYTLNEIKNASHKQCFQSPVFRIQGIKFYIELFPNGSNDYLKGKVVLYLCLATNSSNISKVSLLIALEIKETNSISTKFDTLERNAKDYSAWDVESVLIDTIQHLDELSIEVTLNILSVIDNNNINMMATDNDNNSYSPSTENRIVPKLNIAINRFEWKINDLVEMDSIKCAKNDESFYSLPFEVHSFKWQLELAPNGSKPEKIGKVGLFLDLLSIPPNISTIVTKYKLIIEETNSVRPMFHAFTDDSSSWGRLSMTDTINLKDLKHLTIKVEMMIIEVYDKNDNEIKNYIQEHETNGLPKLLATPDSLQSNTKLISNEWRISDKIQFNKMKNARMGEWFHSKPFAIGSIKFCLVLYPNYKENNNDDDFGRIVLGLRIISMPPNISQVTISYMLSIKETNTKWDCIHDFHSKSMMLGWPTDKMKTVEIQKLDEITIAVDIIVMDVYNDNDHKIDDFMSISKPSVVNMKTSDMYEWIICDDKELIKNIKTASSVTTFTSPIFEVYGIRFYLGLSPNGSRISREGKFNLFLNLLSIRSKTISFVIKYDLSFLQSNECYIVYHAFNKDLLCSGIGDWSFKTTDIQKLDTFTMGVKISLIDVYENDEIITNEYIKQNNDDRIKFINLPSHCYQWNISKQDINTNVDECHSDIFEMYGMRWNVYINGITENKKDFVNLCLYNLSLKPSFMINKNAISRLMKLGFDDENAMNIIKVFDGYNEDYIDGIEQLIQSGFNKEEAIDAIKLSMNKLDDNDDNKEEEEEEKENDLIVCIKYSINIKETNTMYVSNAILSKNEYFVCWGPDRMKKEIFINLDHCTMDIIIELVDVYTNNNQQNITKNYTSYDNTNNQENKCIVSIQQELDSIIQMLQRK